MWCYREAGQDPAAATTTVDQDETDAGQRRALICAACAMPVTTAKERIEKREKHHHTFFNPAGIVYEIGCFRRAPGCFAEGRPSPEFAWFAGYHWQIVFCVGCRLHLGWKFVGEDVFFGLIVNRLSEN